MLFQAIAFPLQQLDSNRLFFFSQPGRVLEQSACLFATREICGSGCSIFRIVVALKLLQGAKAPMVSQLHHQAKHVMSAMAIAASNEIPSGHLTNGVGVVQDAVGAFCFATDPQNPANDNSNQPQAAYALSAFAFI